MCTDNVTAGIAQTLGVVDEHTPRNTLRALQRHLKRAREALIRADG